MSDEWARHPGVLRYASADSFRVSLLALTRNAARADPTRDAQTRQRLFCFNRLLLRVFSHPEATNGHWALKGAPRSRCGPRADRRRSCCPGRNRSVNAPGPSSRPEGSATNSGGMRSVPTTGNIIQVPKIRRGGYVFLAWVGDHSPRHVHVYRDGKLVVKWDLDNWQAMKGTAGARVERLLRELVKEGKL